MTKFQTLATTFTLAAALLTTGCASVGPHSNISTADKYRAGGTAAGGVVGYGVGRAIGGGTGGIIGGAVGAVGGFILGDKFAPECSTTQVTKTTRGINDNKVSKRDGVVEETTTCTKNHSPGVKPYTAK